MSIKLWRVASKEIGEISFCKGENRPRALKAECYMYYWSEGEARAAFDDITKETEEPYAEAVLERVAVERRSIEVYYTGDTSDFGNYQVIELHLKNVKVMNFAVLESWQQDQEVINRIEAEKGADKVTGD